LCARRTGHKKEGEKRNNGGTHTGAFLPWRQSLRKEHHNSSGHANGHAQIVALPKLAGF
jgi:hypothetical protein